MPSATVWMPSVWASAIKPEMTARLFAACDLAEKLPVQLMASTSNSLSESQRGKADAKVIQRAENRADASRRWSSVQAGAAAHQKSGFGQFHFQYAVGDAVLLFQTQKRFQIVWIFEVHTDRLKGDRQGCTPLVHPAAEQGADLFKEIKVQCADAAVPLEQGDKLSRWDHAVFGVAPPDQCLRTAQSPVAQAHLWLQINIKVAVGKGEGKPRVELLFTLDLFDQVGL